MQRLAMLVQAHDYRVNWWWTEAVQVLCDKPDSKMVGSQRKNLIKAECDYPFRHELERKQYKEKQHFIWIIRL